MPGREFDPPLRADARLNREALLRAGRIAFADRGLGVPFDDIATAAGVGRATLYRRFPTRDALLEAIFDDDVDRLEQVVELAGDSADALGTVFDALGERLQANLGLMELLIASRNRYPFAAEIERRLVALVERPLGAARLAGRVRRDLTAHDVFSAIVMIGAVTASTRGAADAEHRRRRARALLLSAAGGTRVTGRCDQAEV